MSAISSLPRIRLGEWPTPLQTAERLSETIGRRILIKREDLTGLASGGNKARKLEFHFGQAFAEQATHILTTGALQSNHAQITAAAARKLGLQPHLVLQGQPPEASDTRSGNLLLDNLLQADLTYAEPRRDQHPGKFMHDEMKRVAEMIRAQGGRPFIIPEGGTDGLGNVGYVVTFQELERQLAELELEGKRTLVVVAAGTCGTLAGLIGGAKLSSGPIDVLGVSISGNAYLKQVKTAKLVNETLALIGTPSELTADDIRIEAGFVGEGYAKMTQEGTDAIRLASQTEGLYLDPVYTGKAFAALLHLGRTGGLDDYEAVVFMHTGGLPLLFHYGAELLF